LENKIVILLDIALIVSIVFATMSQIVPGFGATTVSPIWKTKAPMPTPRGQAAIITGDDGLIYVMGGYNGTAVFNITQAFNPQTNAWTTKADMPQKTRGSAVAKGSDGIIYVIGGYVSGYLATVQAYNTTSNMWTTKTGIPTGVWMAGAATGLDGKIYVIGGEGGPTKTQIYNPETDAWASGLDIPTGRLGLGVVRGADCLIYAIGGYSGTALSVVEAYNPSTNTWTTKASMPLPRLEFGAALGLDGKIYVIGGGTSYGNNAEPFLDTVQIYDHNTDTWTIPSWSESRMPTARKEFSVAMDTNGRFYAIGGANGEYINVNEQAIIDNAAPTAYIDSITPNPTSRGQSIYFSGHGSDSDGSVTAYKWRSSLNGTISTSASFSVSTLIVGTHTIYFSVKDDSGAWSNEAMAIVTVNRPITEDPTYQQLLNANQTLNERIDGLTEQNTNLKTQVDGLTEQNSNLTDKIDSLTQSLSTTTTMLLGVGVVTIILVVVAIAVVFMRKPKAAA
jgi:N-acetylneuraminic acid mutarotase